MSSARRLPLLLAAPAALLCGLLTPLVPGPLPYAAAAGPAGAGHTGVGLTGVGLSGTGATASTPGAGPPVGTSGARPLARAASPEGPGAPGDPGPRATRPDGAGRDHSADENSAGREDAAAREAPAPDAGSPEALGGPGAAGSGAAGAPAGAEVARLHAAAEQAAREYATVRRTADRQRVRAERARALLAEERHRTDRMRRDVGRLAREQYRRGGRLPQAAGLLTARNPEELLRGARLASQARRTLDHAVTRARDAERSLAVAKRDSGRAARELADRDAALTALRTRIDAQLYAASARLQAEADQAVQSGQCPPRTPVEPAAPVPKLPWVAPVDAYALSAGFDAAGGRWAHRHTGQDFAVPIGTPVHAVGAGRVVRVSCGGSFGMEVVVEHPGGWYTQYAHLAGAAVAEGEHLRAGQWVGQSGTTGNSTGPHLHFEVRTTPAAGSALDPLPWLAERQVVLSASAGPLR